jgi:hypothetical protein
MTDLEFVQTNKGSERRWERKRWGRLVRSVLLKDYDVFTQIDGQRVLLGRVYQGLTTFERAPRGARVVSARWSSPRWYSEVVGTLSYRIYYETRKSAASALVRDFARKDGE